MNEEEELRLLNEKYAENQQKKEDEKLDEEIFQRVSPETSLDFNLMVTNSIWGDNKEIPKTFRKNLDKITTYVDKDGNVIKTTKRNLWDMLRFLTRDFRLGNLSSVEITYCDHYSKLAAEFLELDFKEPFFICLSRIATTLELSQSRGGFFRKQSNTLTSERVNYNKSEQSRGLFKQKMNSKGY